MEQVRGELTKYSSGTCVGELTKYSGGTSGGESTKYSSGTSEGELTNKYSSKVWNNEKKCFFSDIEVEYLWNIKVINKNGK